MEEKEEGGRDVSTLVFAALASVMLLGVLIAHLLHLTGGEAARAAEQRTQALQADAEALGRDAKMIAALEEGMLNLDVVVEANRASPAPAEVGQEGERYELTRDDVTVCLDLREEADAAAGAC